MFWEKMMETAKIYQASKGYQDTIAKAREVLKPYLVEERMNKSEEYAKGYVDGYRAGAAPFGSSKEFAIMGYPIDETVKILCEWENRKKEKTMTRNEARQIFVKQFGESWKHSYADNWLNVYEALGLIKFEEEKKECDAIALKVNNSKGDYVYVAMNEIREKLNMAGFAIVGKD